MKKKYFLRLSVILTVLFVTACSQTLPNIANATASVIFEFKDEESKPSYRLSVFVESIENVRRCENLIVRSVSNGYEWNSDDIVIMATAERMFSGYTNLVVPAKDKIPAGLYNIKYIQSDEEEKQISVDLKYDDTIYDCVAADIPELMNKVNGTNRIAIFNKDNVLLYYGDRSDSLKDVRGIWNNYRDADYYYDVWCAPKNMYICVMPVQTVTLEK